MTERKKEQNKAKQDENEWNMVEWDGKDEAEQKENELTKQNITM